MSGFKNAVIALAAMICLIGETAHAQGPAASLNASAAATAFEKLSSLVGSWKRAGSDGSKFKIEFELTANDSVLIERWVGKGKIHSLTIYHRDGESLMATHYCPQGNQPRLKMENTGDDNRISFDFYDATNLENPDQSHQHRLSFDLSDTAMIVRGEAYRKGASSEQSELSLVRIKE